MDGSFAFALLIVSFISMGNLGLLLFGVSARLLSGSPPMRRFGLSALVAVSLTCATCALYYHQLLGRASDINSSYSQYSGLLHFGSVFAFNVLGLGALVWLAIMALRSRSRTWIKVLTWVGLLFAFVHALLTLAVLWVLWSFIHTMVVGLSPPVPA